MRKNSSPGVWTRVSAFCLLALLPHTCLAQAQASSSPAAQAHSSIATGQQNQVRQAAINRHQFTIPFSLAANTENIVEVLLFQSTDRGRTWNLHSRQSPTAQNFPFTCEQDGEFWFAVRSQSRDGTVIPSGQLFPDLQVLVDTRQPELSLEVRPDAAGRIIATWRAEDINLDHSSLNIEYQTSTSGSWKTVENLNPSGTGRVFQSQLAWWPDASTKQIRVKAEIKDKAGNVASVTREIVIPQIANLPHVQAQTASATKEPTTSSHANFNSNSENSNRNANPTQPRFAASEFEIIRTYPSQGGSNEPPPAPNSVDQQAQTVQNRPLPVPGHQQNPGNAIQPQLWDSQFANGSGSGRLVEQASHTQIGRGPVNDQNSRGLVVTEGSTLNKSNDGFTRPIGAAQAETMHAANDGNLARPQQVQANRPAISGNTQAVLASASERRIPEALLSSAKPINSQRFSLDYEIDAVGPSGVKEITLWCTTDGGQNWRAWGVDEDRVTPFKVEVPQDGLYGFRIVISSNDGLSGRMPRPGDSPDVLLLVDTKSPTASITSAPFGTGAEVGHLVIQWQADDEYLALRPITLSYSRQSQGPWTTIAAGLRNEGRYIWKPELQVPDQVYLRLEAIDTAGNAGIDISALPLDIAGLKPRGHIRDVRPIRASN
ncbi:MAG TPA: hypothetical protein PKD64_16615 [Pirellulaceae bacterium]|nr:hypothetical protein [Pirellulaceae bacterium]HMO93814.1 hypothetical protein [Pirellulaceae bacterium]HMP70673.1 hypothetical protein [Pirellulaceae bacterium]